MERRKKGVSMKRKAALCVIITLIFSMFLMSGCLRRSKGRITIKGSTTVLPIMQKASEKFNKKQKTRVRISIESSSSFDGLNALLNKSCDIATSSRKINLEELQKAKDNGQQIKEFIIANDMIVPIVNVKNPINNITIAQLKAIYEGKITNWKELNGNDAEISVMTREVGSGTLHIWYERVIRGTVMIGEAQPSNDEVLRTVFENENAIGFVGYGYARKHVKPLSLDGIVPNSENAKLGKYALLRELYMYIDENNTSEKAMNFINFLMSPDGVYCVTDAGYIVNK